MPLSAPQLFDVLDAAITDASMHRPRLRPLRRRPVVWFTTGTIRIDEREWAAVRRDGDRYGYTLRQARQMRDALLPVLAAYTAHLEAAARRLHPDLTEEPR